VIRVLVADDHAVVRRGLREILEDAGDIQVGGEASNAAEVRRQVQDHRWDVVVLDISMPGGTGIDLVGEIARLRPEIRVVILTVHSAEQYAVRALRAGAAGFLTKEMAPGKLVEAVRKVAHGGRYVTEELAETLASIVAGEASGAPHDRLSNREFEVLKLLASGRTVSQIAQSLALSVKTVSTHRTRILKKMRMGTNAELTHYAVKAGLVE
jgi:DNA-binding NarL/FixJ family response regulator